MSTPAAVQSAAQRQAPWAIESGRIAGALIYFLYGVEGIGKSTFAKDAGATVLDIERGTRELVLDRFKEPDGGWTWPLVLELLRWLATGEHKHRAVAIDTLDGLESLIWRYICGRDEQANIEAYGYGKGYVSALDEWKVFVAAVEHLKIRRGLDVFLLAHAQVSTFKNPEGDDFDRYQPAIHHKAAGLLKGRSDMVLFGNHETFAKKKDAKSKVEKAKGVSTGRRVIYTTRTAAYDAKNRHDLPPVLEHWWADLSAAIKASNAATPADLRRLIEEKAAQMKSLKGPEGEKAWADALGAIKRVGDDVQKLRQLNNWSADRLDELAEQS